MLAYKQGWNNEIKKYAKKYGKYAAYLESFDAIDLVVALLDAKGHFNDYWSKKLLDDVHNIHDKKNVVTIEQGVHQPESSIGGGFVLHFTARDADNIAFHFYITQKEDGSIHIYEITYMNGGKLMKCPYLI